MIFIMKSFFACVIVLALMTACQAGSFSMSCTTDSHGQMKCVRNSDPNGNMARASSFSNGVNGEMYAGAGRPDEYQTNYDAFISEPVHLFIQIPLMPYSL
ncbi:UNVERIFIED_CONTAM: hypothetical protein NCL1_55217 [Trichonephila clavipes]